PEYFNPGVSKRIDITEILSERNRIKSISGFVVLNPQLLFQQEDAVTGRWVTTYPELDYFEFHLTYEPLMDRALKKAIVSLFPNAKYIVTTFRPFKPESYRSFRVVFPKNESLFTY